AEEHSAVPGAELQVNELVRLFSDKVLVPYFHWSFQRSPDSNAKRSSRSFLCREIDNFRPAPHSITDAVALYGAASVRENFGLLRTFAYRSNAGAYYLHLWIVLVRAWYTGIPWYANHCKGVKNGLESEKRGK